MTDFAPAYEATSLTTAEFHDRVLGIAPKVAVFDCDGTLWSGDAGSTFMRWTMGEYDAPPVLSHEKIQWLRERYDGYNRGDVSELAICGEMVQVYEDIPVEVLRAEAAKFFAARIARNIFPEMLALVTELQRRGCDIWAVSSTNDWVIEEGLKHFGIPADRVLSARVEMSAEGLATATLLDVPTDEGKVASLVRAGIAAPDCVFGNSVHDAAMLAIARGSGEIGGAFPVNPSPALLRRSGAEGWPVYFPASVAPTQAT